MRHNNFQIQYLCLDFDSDGVSTISFSLFTSKSIVYEGFEDGEKLVFAFEPVGKDASLDGIFGENSIRRSPSFIIQSDYGDQHLSEGHNVEHFEFEESTFRVVCRRNPVAHWVARVFDLDCSGLRHSIEAARIVIRQISKRCGVPIICKDTA